MKFPNMFGIDDMGYRKVWEAKYAAIFYCWHVGSGNFCCYVVKPDNPNNHSRFTRFATFAKAYFYLTGLAWAVAPEILELHEQADQLMRLMEDK